MSELESAAQPGAEAVETSPETGVIETAATEEQEAAAVVDGEQEQQDEQDAEEVEFDLGGGQKVKFKANATAKEIAEHAQRAFKDVEANFTRKGQEVAELRKSIEARAQTVAKMESLNGEALQEYSKGMQIRSELDRLNSIDLAPLWQSNPDQARMISDRKSALIGEFNATVAKVTQIEQGMTQAQQAEEARIAAEGEARLEKLHKGFAQKVPEIIDYVASTYGIDKDHAARVWKMDSATASMAYKAMMFDRMQAKVGKPASPAPQAQPVAPMKATGMANASTKDPSKMSMSEYAKWRAAGNG